METEKEIYIKKSIININEYINKNDYRKAFFLLVFVLEKLDANNKQELIEYYSNNIHLFDLSSYYEI